MAGKRGPESFMKRQRERQKQQEQLAKAARRRERSAQKKDAKHATADPFGQPSAGFLRPANPGPTPPWGLR
jgi:hypothetical protein